MRRCHDYVVVETSKTNIYIEMTEDGTLILESRPECLTNRINPAAAVRSSDCRDRQLTIRDMRTYLKKHQRKCKHFAQDVYGFLSGDAIPLDDGIHIEKSPTEHVDKAHAHVDEKEHGVESQPSTSQAPCVDCNVPFGEDAQILERFQQDGFVVVTDVFNDELVTKTLNELWESPRLLGRDTAVKRNDKNTWTAKHWPQQDGGLNFLESLDPYQDQGCWEFAQHPNALHVLKLLWRDQGVQDLFVKAPRWGIMRPTATNPEWRTLESWLHWDQNPWSQPGFGWVQAFACLSDQTPTSGGLLCVPGFQRRWCQWGADHEEGTLIMDGREITREYGAGKPFPVPKDDPIQREVVRVLAPRGSLVLWDSRLPHQNFPNTGEDFRVVMYLSFSQSNRCFVEERKKELLKKAVVMRALDRVGFWPQGLTSLGREVTGSPNETELSEANRVLAEEPLLAPAIKLAVEAGEEELQGNLTASCNKMRESEKLYPEISKWHEAIFG